MTAKLKRKRKSHGVRDDYVKSIRSRERILIAAAETFRDRGYVGATLRMIGLRAGIGAGSVYYYFNSKEEILREVLERAIDTVEAMVYKRVNAVAPEASPLERLFEAIHGHLSALFASGHDMIAYARIWNQLPVHIKQRDNPRRVAYVKYWRKLIERAKDAGELSQDLDVVNFVEYMLGAMARAPDWYDIKAGGIDEIASQVFGWSVHGVRPAANERKEKRSPEILNMPRGARKLSNTFTG